MSYRNMSYCDVFYRDVFYRDISIVDYRQRTRNAGSTRVFVLLSAG